MKFGADLSRLGIERTAGQAIQNMNLMFGLEERTGLLLVGGNP